ncbi:LacI family DNA-binding transcriptional regulator [Chthonobacter albigriseus]|uniref:LacI family DNA-binding transcriptional regulator n=1 Tax=Chthonobacter albigriseus TaxID=1683161 RepID=UPI0015EF16DB|nr:LacI family DNA-binding transcriptional regulator [Chthonobacter albigriseus]
MSERVTIADVARRAGVAISSVSSALNDRSGVSEETRRRIRLAADELGYVASIRGRSLSSDRAYAVGLIVRRAPAAFDRDSLLPAFVGGVQSMLETRGYVLVLLGGAPVDDKLQGFRRLMADRRVDGVLLQDIRHNDPRIPGLLDIGLPAVGIDAHSDGFPFPVVHQDCNAAIRTLARTLVEAGHGRIAYLTGPRPHVRSWRTRMLWREALRDYGVVIDPVVEGDGSFEDGERAAEQLMAGREPPTAVVAASDAAALGFARRARALGFRIPQDVSIVGFDGVPAGRVLDPTLTTVRTSPFLIGAKAAALLLESLGERKLPDVPLPPAEIEPGGTIGPSRNRERPAPPPPPTALECDPIAGTLNMLVSRAEGSDTAF